MSRSQLFVVGLGAALIGSVGVASCADLEPVEAGVCGNRVLEPELGEDCDGSASRWGVDARCGEPDTASACRLVCAPTASTTGCPPGWGCGIDGICRRPSAELEQGSLPGEVRAVGDLDGDGRDDIVMRGPQGEAQVAYFTEGRNLAELFIDPARRTIADSPAVQPIVARLTNDEVDDLALPLVGDDVSIRVFMGGIERELENPFVELVTVPFGATGQVWMRTAFNPLGVPQAICEIGGCAESLVIGKTKDDETRYAVLVDRELTELFRLPDGRARHSAALARFDAGRSCDVLAVSYRAKLDATPAPLPGNIVELFPLCIGHNQLNISAQLEPLGPVDALVSVSVGSTEADDAMSLTIAATADIDGDGNPDLLLDRSDLEADAHNHDGPTYVLWGTGDGHFNARVDHTGEVDVADTSTPLILGHSWASAPNLEDRIARATWPRAAADVNADGRADFLLTAGIVALSTNDPSDTCVVAGETVLAGPPVGPTDEPQWGYACVLMSDTGLIDAASATRADAIRDYLASDSLAISLDLQGQGRPGFAAIDKNKLVYTGQLPDHTPPDFLDLIWVDSASAQLIVETLTAERIEQVAAGDIDGDFRIDLVLDNGKALQTISGPPFDLARATSFSPVEFDELRVFGEGLPSASIGGSRGGRLTIFRDGQWPALALVDPGACAQPQDCHVRFAAGALDHANHFAWALGVVRTTSDDGLRLLRAIDGEANLGPAYDSASAPLLSLATIEISAPAGATTVLALALDDSGIETAVVAARTATGIELALLRPYLDDAGTDGELCGPTFASEASETGSFAVCFEHLGTLEIDDEVRPQGPSEDPFVDIADTDGDGNPDLSWVTENNEVFVLLNRGTGQLSLDDLVVLAIPEPPEDDDAEPAPRPARIDWIRWMELDGTLAREIVSSDTLGGPDDLRQLWGIDVHLDTGVLDPRGALALQAGGRQNLGYVGDFDGDGIDDVAVGKQVLFGQPVND